MTLTVASKIQILVQIKTAAMSHQKNINKKRPKNDHSPDPPAKKKFWSLGLIQTMKDPKFVVKTDNKITIIKDMYPKAQHHFLVIPNDDISSLKSVNKTHLVLLKHMETTAKDYVQENHLHTNFKYGYHAEASMHRLHLHVISEDMNSPSLKTKKHWNTFTTNFFIDSNRVIDSLEKFDKVELPSKEKCKEFMDTALKCHKCSVRPRNMPELKRHIVSHL